ncbi:MAG: hypothetical protein ISN26_06725 [Betaproteobacteria bacterium AqS2]|uniref:HNH nuclease domain-containing protein n=1 Tax=Candidatus Amphirhobacter heronislandensis TaxID=1732024 RepID=A0A930Y3C2_9GAMM|nr:hypothetical protein [Betaproteobacteria bacterium AqS2]
MADRKHPANELPSDKDVTVAYLDKALDKTTNSYKFLLLKTILQCMEDYRGQGHLAISFDLIRRGKLANSWFPSLQFRLNFGKQDQIEKALRKVETIVPADAYTSIEQVNRALEEEASALSKVKAVQDLTEYSIGRLIRRAFDQEVAELKQELKQKGVKPSDYDYQIKIKIPGWSRKRFEGDDPPIYRIEDKAEIVIHERWCRYLSKNLKIINGWLDNQWMQTLARKNPNVPGLAHKLWELPNDRDSLRKQRDGWEEYLRNHALDCIYSQPVSRIDNAEFALDHFLPRSWVGHDQMWNLIPIAPKTNSRKKHFLPARDEIEKLASAHFDLLDFAFNNEFPHRSNMLDDYRFGLHVKDAVLKDREKLHEAYLGTIEPLLLLAHRQGFRYWPEEDRILRNGN